MTRKTIHRRVTNIVREDLSHRAIQALIICKEMRLADLADVHTAKKRVLDIGIQPFMKCVGIGRRTALELQQWAQDEWRGRL